MHGIRLHMFVFSYVDNKNIFLYEKTGGGGAIFVVDVVDEIRYSHDSSAYSVNL